MNRRKARNRHKNNPRTFVFYGAGAYGERTKFLAVTRRIGKWWQTQIDMVCCGPHCKRESF